MLANFSFFIAVSDLLVLLPLLLQVLLPLLQTLGLVPCQVSSTKPTIRPFIPTVPQAPYYKPSGFLLNPFNNRPHFGFGYFPSLFRAKRSLSRIGKRKCFQRSSRMKKIRLYRKIPLPGTRDTVTVRTKDLMKYINVFFRGKRFTLKTSDLVNMKDYLNAVSRMSNSSK